MIIRHAAMDDLEAVTELEAKCFPAAEAAGSEAFSIGWQVFLIISGCSTRMKNWYP